MKALLLATLALSPALGQDSTRLRWVPNPRVTNGGWVADPARHLKPATVAQINATLSTLERETSAEIAVAVLDSLDGLEPGAAALLLHRRWGVGKAARDNGVVLLWSPALRKIHVSVGYGLEGVLTDGRAGRIQDQAIIPRFRVNDFDGGIVAGVEALAAVAREEKYTGPPRARSTSSEQQVATGGRSSGGPLGVLAGIGTALLLGLAGLWASMRPRRCPKGHGAMRKLDETQDDAFLQREAILEEQLGSMNYHVWVCNVCDERAVVARRKWFSGYEECPECKRRTVLVKTRQLRAATYSSTGEREVTRTCRNCRWSRKDHETIPMLEESSSSSSSSSGGGGGGGGGGSSFGGGSSGGGGAGRSY